MNHLTDDTKATLLLCGVFGKDQSAKPLTQKEYTDLALRLKKANMRPGDLLSKNSAAEISTLANGDRQRFESLLKRGVQLGFSIEEWQRHGIWVISRSDSEYPERYKRHLKHHSPPLLYGVGDRSRLSGGGLAIVGSRNIDEDGEHFTRHVAQLCAYNGVPVVSGGARGVDRISMATALEAEGIVIGVLADSLLRRSVDQSVIQAIAEERLLLLSPHHPNAGFSAGGAMSRNKLIYAMADYALVVSAEHKKGGTWAGAEEELKREASLPVFVRNGNGAPPGNAELIKLGAVTWPANIDRENFIRQLSDPPHQTEDSPQPKNLSLF